VGDGIHLRGPGGVGFASAVVVGASGCGASGWSRWRGSYSWRGGDSWRRGSSQRERTSKRHKRCAGAKAGLGPGAGGGGPVSFRAHKEAVGELGSPPTGLPALVARRREHRVTGGGARTERRSLAPRGPTATGSRQTARGDVPQRRKNAGKKTYARGLDNSGNIEGSPKPLFASPLPPSASAGGHRSLAVMAAAPARSGALPQRPQLGVARHCAAWTGGAGWGTLMPQGVPYARTSGRPVGGTISNGISQVQRGQILCHCAHVAYGSRWRGPTQTRISLGDNGQGRWEVERRPA
jgi:hypothetical protein